MPCRWRADSGPRSYASWAETFENEMIKNRHINTNCLQSLGILIKSMIKTVVYSYLNAGIIKFLLTSMDNRLCLQFKSSGFESLTILLVSLFCYLFFLLVLLFFCCWCIFELVCASNTPVARVPKTYVHTDGLENIYNFTLKN